MIKCQILRDLRVQVVARHVISDIDRRGKAIGSSAAMAFDNDAVKAKEYAAVDLVRIHLLTQPVKRGFSQKIADLGK
ncbi:hypothetical protein D3C87_1758640 [compost metagenome]